MNAPAFTLHNLGKSFAGVFACRGVSLDVLPGTVLAIAGENGAGKSTLMKCLHGFYVPTEGHVEVQGMAAAFASPRDAEAAGISMIPQELDLFPELSIVENLYVGQPRPRNRWGIFDQRGMRRRAQGLLASLGVTLDVSAAVKSLSAASCKLVEIARAMNRDARLIIMDEPTAALSDREVQKLFAVIEQLKARGIAVIYITHRLEEIFAISDRIMVLRDGSLVASGATRDFDIPTLIEAMIGRPIQERLLRRAHRPGNVALELRQFGRRGQFAGVDLVLRAGEVLGVAGLIGAGRSELAQAICGIAPADRGEMLIDGRPVRINSIADAATHRIAYLPEERRSQGLVLPFSIAHNISFAALAQFTRFGFIDRGREGSFAHEALRRFAIRGGDIDVPVEVLSGGNQQKVLIAKTLALEPNIIIFDEPTRGVDVGAKSEIYALIDELVRQGKAILLITSEMNEVLDIADRIMVMCEGRVTGSFPRSGFSARAVAAAAAGQSVPHVA
jgi:rhamnose transport system ATP-binding protein